MRRILLAAVAATLIAAPAGAAVSLRLPQDEAYHTLYILYLYTHGLWPLDAHELPMPTPPAPSPSKDPSSPAQDSQSTKGSPRQNAPEQDALGATDAPAQKIISEPEQNASDQDALGATDVPAQKNNSEAEQLASPIAADQDAIGAADAPAPKNNSEAEQLASPIAADQDALGAADAPAQKTDPEPEQLASPKTSELKAPSGAGAKISDGIAAAIAHYYRVVRGDCLWRLSRSFYGRGAKWPIIYKANASSIVDPDLIYIDQMIEIPSLISSMQ